MQPILRLLGIGAVFVLTSIAWLVLGGVTESRTVTQRVRLDASINELWGRPQQQQAPSLRFRWRTEEVREETQTQDGKTKVVRTRAMVEHEKPVSAASSSVAAALDLDPRLKGLIWYALYDVRFDGRYRYVHDEAEHGALAIEFRFPDAAGIYDDFTLVVNGVERPEARRPSEGAVRLEVPVAPGDTVEYAVGYRSRGLDAWVYQPGEGAASLRDFTMAITTDFDAIDFAPSTMSPSAKARVGDGWRLDWRFRQVVTGQGIGLSMPTRIQPGELASALSFSAPISLFFFFLVVFVLATLRGLEIHPVNYLFLGGAFFAFHLLFAYLVDHLAVVPAFAVASVVSIALVTSYLRLVVSSRFAFVEAALAQLLYLVGFSLAHFFDHFTGLTVTVLSIATLFLLMQLTGRLRWAEVFTSRRSTATGGGADAIVGAR
jgi:hypothetical protein